MAGLFSKGGTPLTPAQQQVQKNALESASRANNTFLPVQQFFVDKTQKEAPGFESAARGAASASARTAGTAARTAGLNLDSNRGAGAGSGAYLLDAGKASDAIATGTGYGLTAGTAAGQKHYVQGLQQIIGIGQKDQAQATSGLNTAASAQAQEAGATQAAAAQNQQGLGQVAGLAASFA